MKKAIFTSLREAPSQHVLLVMVHPWYPLLPPLGLAYVSRFIRSKGYNVLLLDFNAKLYNNCDPERKKFWDISTISRIPYPQLVEIFKEKFPEEIETLISLLAERPEPIIGFSTNYLNVKVASYIARMIKERNSDKLIVFGGPGCFWEHDRKSVIPGSVDFFVIGEGEKPFAELVDNFYKGRSLEGIIGIISSSEDKQGRTSPIMNLDEIPFPDFREFDLKDYGCGEARALPLLTSRGCISKCSFCVDHMMCNPFRMRSPEHVVAEIEHHMKEYNIRNFSFNDLLCNGDLKKLERICDLIIEKKLDIKWGSYAVARGDMSLELLQKMKQAGCTTICYGIESGSNRVLKMMRKIYTAEDAQRTLRLTHQAGIKSTFNIIIGYPQEGKKEFKETLAFVKRNKDYIDSIINVSTLFINPTASLGREPQKYGLYFPKSPHAFKFISLKKLIPGYYKIFGQMTPVERLQGVDISEFTDRYGNTKNVRIKRLVKTLDFVNKLGLFKEDPIINVYITKSKKVSRIIDRVQKRWTIENGDLCLKCDYKGLAKLYYHRQLISKNQGLNIAFFANGEWCDSSHSEWKIRKVRKNILEIIVPIKKLNIYQRWKLILKPNMLRWKVYTWFDPKKIVEEMKMGVLFIPEVYKFWRAEKIGGELSDPEEKWKSIILSQKELTILPQLDYAEIYPELNFNIWDHSFPDWKLRLETSSRSYDFRYVNIWTKLSYDVLQNYGHRIYTELDLGIFPFEKDHIIQIQKRDESRLRKIYPSDWDSEDLNIEVLSLSRRKAEIFINERKIRLFYNNKELTESLGVNFVFVHNRNIYEDSNATEWRILRTGEKNAVIEANWSDLPVSLKWELKLVREGFLVAIVFNLPPRFPIQEMKWGILLNSCYRYWEAGDIRGYLPFPEENKWIEIPVKSRNNCNLVLYPENERFPVIQIQEPQRSKLQLEVSASKQVTGVFFRCVPRTGSASILRERVRIKLRSSENKN